MNTNEINDKIKHNIIKNCNFNSKLIIDKKSSSSSSFTCIESGFFYLQTELIKIHLNKFLLNNPLNSSQINNMMDNLKKKFIDIHLLRNELFFKIYNFSDGQAFQPDFVLFMKKKNGEEINYQLFIEPKGDQSLEKDSWKEKFLLEIEKKFKIDKIWESKKLRIIGMPFYNKDFRETEFREKVGEIGK